MPNRLIHALSPYLRQHADNPVDWYPWGEEALEKARRENKPIFLSIGYTACHWCHVMAHESFEDEEIAQILNEHFVPIKVDREERPDLDHLYMQATIALTGQGGWPMSVFLTPDLKPFFAGTYFPKEPRYRLPSFRQVLLAITQAWQTERERLRNSAEYLARQLQASFETTHYGVISSEWLEDATTTLIRTYDWVHGGWSGPPKFPHPLAIEFLLRQALKGNQQALEVSLHALRCMAKGGMYDVVGGGFHRYSVDALWLVPHFEKMLYDNALLARAYLHAWQITGDSFFREVCERTLAFIARELLHPEGGFFSSLDADSEDQEGKYYVWTEAELQEILGEEYPLFKRAYGIREYGNWEGKTVLQRVLDDQSLAVSFQLPIQEVQKRLLNGMRRLFERRRQRISPLADRKVLTSWNGLALATMAEAGRVLGLFEDVVVGQVVDCYLLATRNASFLLQHLRQGYLYHSWYEGQPNSQTFLEDYASLIVALLELYQTDFDPKWYAPAKALTQEMLNLFGDGKGKLFDTLSSSELPFRPRQLEDNATPSGNALAVTALIMMSAFEGKQDWYDFAVKTLEQAASLIGLYPLSFAQWLIAADLALTPFQEIALVGPSIESIHELLSVVRREWRPNTIVAASTIPIPQGSPALLENRLPIERQPTAYVCHHFICKQPITTPEGLAHQLRPNT